MVIPLFNRENSFCSTRGLFASIENSSIYCRIQGKKFIFCIIALVTYYRVFSRDHNVLACWYRADQRYYLLYCYKPCVLSSEKKATFLFNSDSIYT